MLKLKPYITLRQIPKPLQSEFEKFATALEKLKSEINSNKDASENNIETFADRFLHASFGYEIIKNEHIDKTIQIDGTVVVQFEFKAPKNAKEMIDTNNINCKALHESIYYYMLQRNINNDEIKRVVIADGNAWFVFDAIDFEKLFWLDKKFNKQFVEFLTEDKKKKFGTTYFYDNIAKPFIDKLIQKNGLLEDDAEIEALHFDVRQMNSEADKIAFFKALSKPYLLKKQAKKDPNSLDDAFYKKLLDLMGLEQTADGGKKVIRRCVEAKRKDGSLLENTIASIKRSKRNPPTDIESAALSLVIIWINRILFLKLLESQLLRYHKNDDKYKFFDFGKLGEYDKLNSLFFEALAKPKDARSTKYKHFENIPYLNSSLFELSVEEDELISVSGLEDDPSYNGIHLLKAFFEFLDSYDFGVEDEESIRSEGKTLISAAVLGLVFEKINGYKDGSFYTPSFITQYMAKEIIQKAVLSKFKEAKGYECDTLADLRNHLGKKASEILEINKIFDTITICDPAVGSGHFLVSCLNELIRTKAELGILADESGMRVNEYEFDIQNNELVVWDASSGKEFVYSEPFGKEASRVQKTLFDEKRRIIENQLFGVDINPNSVNICRLRLWIEILKNAYYKDDGKLETLPNIDINIKCGNSLVSLFPIKSPLMGNKMLENSLKKYAEFVAEYKNTTDKSFKLKAAGETKSIENAFIRYQFAHGKEAQELRMLVDKFTKKHHASFLPQEIRLYFGAKGSTSMFGDKDENTTPQDAKNAKAIEKDKNEILKKYELYKQMEARGGVWANALEWRYIFPEVVDENGDFVGFDVVIGNPPYIPLSKLDTSYSGFNYQVFDKTGDIFALFFERSISVLRNNGHLSFIVSNGWLRTKYGEPLKRFFATTTTNRQIVNFEDVQIFDEATVESCIVGLTKANGGTDERLVTVKKPFDPRTATVEILANFVSDGGDSDEVSALMRRIESVGKPLKEWEVTINYGIKTGFNEAFIIDNAKKEELMAKDAKSAELLKPMLRGRDVQKYVANYAGLWLINSHNNPPVNIEKYSAIKAHLDGYCDKLEKRGDKGKTPYNLRNCAYLADFEKPKIVWGEISDEPKFAYEDSGFYAEATNFILTGEKLKYLIAVLNSKFSKWYFQQISTTTGMGTNRWKKFKLELLPIAEPKDEKPFIDLVDKILNLKKSGGDTSELEDKIDAMVYELYGLSDDEIKTIKGEK